MRKFIFGFVVLVPLLYGLALLAFAFSGGAIESMLNHLYVPVALVFVLGWFLYVSDVVRNQAVGDKRNLWVALLLFGTVFAQVAYYFAYVVRTRAAPDGHVGN